MSRKMSRKPKELTEDDRQIWEKVAKTVDPYSRSPRPEKQVISDSMSALMSETVDSRSAKVGPTERPKHRSWHMPDFSPVINKPKQPVGESRANPVHHPIDHKTRKNIIKGKRPIDATIDLHGMKQERAHTALARFLDMAFASHHRTVLVITGKGVKGEGVLRRLVPIWLSEPRMAQITNGFQEAHAGHGGSGALYVRIRRIRAGTP